MSLPDWDDFRLLLTIVQTGSFSRAANELGLTQPTVSRRMARLEQTVGAQLMDRTNSGIALTAEGQRVVEELHVAHGAILRAIGRARSSAPRFEDVKLMTTDGLATFWLPHFLPHLFEKHPEVELKVYTVTDPRVERQDLDISIHFRQPSDPKLTAAWLGTLHFLPFASPGYIARYGRPRSAAELANHRLLDHMPYLIDKGTWETRLPETTDVARAVYYSNSSAALGEAIRKGTGIGLLPTYGLLFESGFTPIDVGLRFATPFWVCYPPSALEKPASRIMIGFLKHIFNSKAMPWFRESYVPPAAFPATTPEQIMASYVPAAEE